MKSIFTTIALTICFACGATVAITFSNPGDNGELVSDGPGAGGGYSEFCCQDGPGAGGGYADSCFNDGPGAGGGYRSLTVSDGPGAGGGYAG